MFRTRGVDMADWNAIDRYMILSSDAHAGAPVRRLPGLSLLRNGTLSSTRGSPLWSIRGSTRMTPATGTRVTDSQRWRAKASPGRCLFPNTLPPFYDILAHLSGVPRDRSDFARRWAGLQAHNRWLVEFCDGAPAQRRGLIQLLPNDVDAAVAEMRWARGHDAIGGVMLPAIAPNHPVEPYYHERYEPLWSTAVELGFPIHQHQGSGAQMRGPAKTSDARSRTWTTSSGHA
jgi:hypothetical protein